MDEVTRHQEPPSAGVSAHAQPGAWPTPRTPLDATLRAAARTEAARVHITQASIRAHLECPHCYPAPGQDHLELGSIRAHLAEQPSPQTIRAAARHWITAITNIADDLIKGRA
ncbi:hypothetical protein ACIPY6_03110 [Streptomyces sp. NPDC090054]|uniref:hypothetical protein n=1 Tax=Streptomyces sp. NPDC090054 TaxID=3365933 RepID=UPI003808AAA5